tara:strand:+ start:26083 stop:27096 length:1014 start_codon:yes stop_codon:yes gene_type:complete
MKILIIGPSWVGDSVMAQTLYKRLTQEESECSIDVISPKWCHALVKRMPEVHKGIVSPFQHGDLKLVSRYFFAKQLRETNYDRSIVLTNSLKSSLIPLFAQIPVRTGWLGEMRYFFLNDIRMLEKKDNDLMVEKFAALSIKEEAYKLENLSFPSLRIDFKNQQERIDGLEINSDLPSLAICPGAEFGPSKKWPPKFYSQVAREYINKGWNVLCFGSINDIDTGIEIQNLNNLLNENNFHNLIGKTSLEDVIDLLAFCEKVVTNDSGLMHIAAAVERPLVALYGPSSPEYTPPLISRRVIIRKTEGYEKTRKGDVNEGYHQSLLSIEPSEVIMALEEI